MPDLGPANQQLAVMPVLQEMRAQFDEQEEILYETYQKKLLGYGHQMSALQESTLNGFLRRSVSIFEDWSQSSNEMIAKFRTLEDKKKIETDLLYQSLIRNAAPAPSFADQLEIGAKKLVDSLFQFLGLEASDLEKSPSTQAEEKIESRQEAEKKEKLTVDQVQKIYRDETNLYFTHREKNFLKFQALLEDSLLEIRNSFKPKFHSHLERQIRTLERQNVTRAGILSQKSKNLKIASRLQSQEKIRSYVIYMIQYFYFKLLDQPQKLTQDETRSKSVVSPPEVASGESRVPNPSKEPKPKLEVEPVAIQKEPKPTAVSMAKSSSDISVPEHAPMALNSKSLPGSSQSMDLLPASTHRSTQKRRGQNQVGSEVKSCPISDLPPIVIERCESDFIVMDLSTSEKKRAFYLFKLESDNYRSRNEAIRYFSRCSTIDKEAVDLARKLKKDPRIDSSQSKSLENLIRLGNNCRSE